jgi:hypothetical protein
MDNNQYFFSNEESNDSNVNMIGGALGPMAPMSQVNRTEGMMQRAQQGNVRAQMFMKRKQAKDSGAPGSGAPGSGAPGSGAPGNDPPVSDPVKDAPDKNLNSNNKSKSNDACKKENAKINESASEIIKLNGKIGSLTNDVNRLSNILITYETQFEAFGEHKKKLDESIDELQKILVTKSARNYLDKAKKMITEPEKKNEKNKQPVKIKKQKGGLRRNKTRKRGKKSQRSSGKRKTRKI